MTGIDGTAPTVVSLVVGHRRVALPALTPPVARDLFFVDRLLRLQVALRRIGLALELTAVAPDLRELIDLVGVADVLGCGRPIRRWPVAIRTGRTDRDRGSCGDPRCARPPPR